MNQEPQPIQSPDSHPGDPATPRFHRARQAALTAVAVNSGLTLAKFLLALVTGSLALWAEAYHSFSDIVSSLAVFLGVSLTPPGLDAPGLWAKLRRNLQPLIALAIGLYLLAVAITILLQTLESNPMGVSYAIPAAMAMLLMALVSLLLSRLESAAAQKGTHPALMADSHHSKVDMVGSLLVASALIAESMGAPLDRPVALAISLFVFLQALKVFSVVYAALVTDKGRTIDYFYPLWFASILDHILPSLSQALHRVGARLFRLDSNQPRWRRRVRSRLLLVALFSGIAAYGISGLFVIQAHQVGVVERFGRPLPGKSPMGPGLHWAFPWPVDTVRKIDASRVRRLAVGAQPEEGEQAFLWTTASKGGEFNLLTGENIFVGAGMVISYQVANPLDYLYGAARPEAVLAQAGHSVLLRRVAGWEFFVMMTTGRDLLERALLDDLAERLASHRLGLKVLAVNLRGIRPPASVAQEFEEVVGAAVDYETFISQAYGYTHSQLPKARGAAFAKVAKAQARRDHLTNSSQGEAARFLANLDQYRLSPRVYQSRRFLEVMEQSLANKEKIITPPKTGGGATELMMPLDDKRMPPDP